MEHSYFADLVRKNRSFRGFDESRRVAREELLQMADCARLSASSANTQPLKYYLAWEKEIVDRIQPLTGWARGLPELKLPYPGTYPTAFIVICQDREIAPSIPTFQKDVGIAAQTILLAAAEMGLGGCMIGSFEAGALREALDLPERLSPQLVVAIGKPAERVVLEETGADGSVSYYRDAEGVHHVPKRRLSDVVIEP